MHESFLILNSDFCRLDIKIVTNNMAELVVLAELSSYNKKALSAFTYLPYHSSL